ncbi:MAG: sulfonate transport system substrate-binding protein [Frankiales bacterium]|jgi:hypothetical protein|nr:sulfonate transport system substrate-binding protein [Frankiales bacterium]
MMPDYDNKNPQTLQKLVNAYVKTLKWIDTHTAAQIADEMLADYYADVGKAAYISALQNEKGIYNPSGIMPPDGPPTNVKVLMHHLHGLLLHLRAGLGIPKRKDGPPVPHYLTAMAERGR